MRTEKKAVLAHLMKQIPKYVVVDSIDIVHWSAKKGVHSEPGVFDVADDTQSELKLGDSWVTGYDQTTWFTASLKIPEHFKNGKTYFEFNIGGEVIVRMNGKIMGSVSSNMANGWVHRERIFAPNPIPDEVEIELEATVNSGGFCDHVLAGRNSVAYTLSKARIVLLDEIVDSYFTDVTLIMEALDYITDEDIKRELYAALDDSLHEIDFDFDESTTRASFTKAQELLWDMIDSIKHMPRGEVIMTGHSHIDVAWLWTVKEVIRKCARTFSNNLELIERRSDIVWTQSQAYLYELLKTHYPELYERVKPAIAAGRIITAGDAWVEADTNIASGESLIRQLLYGREFFMNEFGVSSEIYWLPDCFGFSYALPQIIKKSGMKYFVTAKLSNQDTNKFPHTLFRWRGIDGSEILAYMQRTHYGDEYNAAKIANAWTFNEQKGINNTLMGMFGYGDGGGGVTEEMLENAACISRIPGLPESHIGSPIDFFNQAEKAYDNLPVIDDELYYENHRGTFTSQGFVKKFNRYGELLLSRAEMMLCFLHGTANGLKPDTELEKAWKLLLINQFHDILPGTSIHEVYLNTADEYNEMAAIGEQILNEALVSMASRYTENGIVCFNLTSGNVRERVKILNKEAGLAPAYAGETAPHNQDGEHLSFIAEVPAMSFRIYDLIREENVASKVTVSTQLLENEKLRVVFDDNGNISSIYDKDEQRDILSGLGNKFSIYADKPVHESAWNLESNYVKKRWDAELVSIRVVESTPVSGVLEIVKRFNKSLITQDVTLYAGSCRIDFITHVDWQETEKLLKADFDVAVRSPFAAYEIAHGAIYRPTHKNTSFDRAKFEVCAHKWADLSEGGYGVAILNDSKYGYNIHESKMSISLLRAPIVPDMVADKGTHDFIYSLYPHKGDWREGRVVQEAFALNFPIRTCVIRAMDKKNAISVDYASPNNDITRDFSFVQCNAENIVLDAIKPAQDGNGLILRAYEAESRRGEVKFTLSLDFSSVVVCDMTERPMETESIVSCEDNSFSFFIKPHEVVTFRIN